jgi:hypothetical protein
LGRQISEKADERTIYAQEKPKEAERDAGLQFIWFNKSTPLKMWQLYTQENQASGRLCESLSFGQPPAKIRELKRRIL